jgi:hypothetical protein
MGGYLVRKIISNIFPCLGKQGGGKTFMLAPKTSIEI